MSSSHVIVNGVKRQIRNDEQLWYYCGVGECSTCSARYQYEADDVQTGEPVLVVQICTCKCHNRAAPPAPHKEGE